MLRPQPNSQVAHDAPPNQSEPKRYHIAAPASQLPPTLETYGSYHFLASSFFALSSTKLSAIASAAALRSLSSASASASSVLAPPLSGLSLASLSSSLSPRLKGSFSAMGLGSTVDSGCHLLALVPPGASLGVFLGDAL